jgi:hypothetical protein
MSSYAVNDFYKRFLNPGASEKRLVAVGRIMTVVFLCLSSAVALYLESALDAFKIILQIGAGTGLVFLLRWVWWRISAYSEIAAMASALAMAFFFKLAWPRLGLAPLANYQQLLIGIGVTTFVWLIVTFLTPPTDAEHLERFYRAVHPGGPGWSRVRARARARAGQPEPEVGRAWDVPLGLLCMILGCCGVYGALFATGNYLYGKWTAAIILTAVSLIAWLAVYWLWPRLNGAD